MTLLAAYCAYAVQSACSSDGESVSSSPSRSSLSMRIIPGAAEPAPSPRNYLAQQPDNAKREARAKARHASQVSAHKAG